MQKDTNNYIRNNIRWLVKGEPSRLFIEMLDSLSTQKNCEVIHDGYFKKVLKYTYNQKSFYIKQYAIKSTLDTLKSFLFISKAHREWDQIHLLLRNHLYTAEPVAVGEKKRFGMLKECYIITKAIPNSAPAKELLINIQQSSSDLCLSKKNTLLRNLVSFIKTMHDRGIFHGELHAENILVTPDNLTLFYLLDLGRTKFKKRPSLSLRIHDLSRMLYSIRDVCTNEEIKDLINNYETFPSPLLTETNKGQDGEDKDSRLFCKAVYKQIYRIKHRLWHSRARKCLKNNVVFKATSYGDYTINTRNEWDVNTLLALINKHTLSVKEGHKNIIKISSKICITNVPVSNESIKSVCIKEYRYLSSLKRIFYSFHNSPARNAWLAAHGLIAYNFQTPKPIALLEEKKFGILKKSFIAMEDISDYLPCNKYVSEKFNDHYNKVAMKKKRRFLSCLALSFKQLHDSEIYHRDLKANNIMINEFQDMWVFFFLDLDRVCFNKSIALKKKIKNLSQLNASLPNCISYTDRLRFYQTYTGMEKLDRKNKLILQKIVQISIRRKHVWTPKTRIIQTPHPNKDIHEKVPF